MRDWTDCLVLPGVHIFLKGSALPRPPRNPPRAPHCLCAQVAAWSRPLCGLCCKSSPWRCPCPSRLPQPASRWAGSSSSPPVAPAASRAWQGGRQLPCSLPAAFQATRFAALQTTQTPSLCAACCSLLAAIQGNTSDVQEAVAAWREEQRDASSWRRGGSLWSCFHRRAFHPPPA